MIQRSSSLNYENIIIFLEKAKNKNTDPRAQKILRTIIHNLNGRIITTTEPTTTEPATTEPTTTNPTTTEPTTTEPTNIDINKVTIKE